MSRRKGLITITATITGVLALAACSSGGDAASGGTKDDFGSCTVHGTAGSVKLTPVTAGVLTVQTNLPSPGWWHGTSPDSIDGGYEYCLAAELAHRAGLHEVKVVNVSFDALVAGRTQDYDIAMAQVSITPARAKVVEFSEPYFESSIGVLTKSGAGVTASTIASKRLGAAVGTTSVDYLKDVLKPTQAPRTFTDTDAMVTAVASGQLDAAVQDTAIMLGFAKQSAGALEVVGQYKTGEHYGAIYPKESANKLALDGGIAAMRTDGSLDALSKTWLGEAFGGDPNAVPSFDGS
jgi:polar amino acid transport system substrate-binding protein